MSSDRTPRLFEQVVHRPEEGILMIQIEDTTWNDDFIEAESRPRWPLGLLMARPKDWATLAPSAMSA